MRRGRLRAIRSTDWLGAHTVGAEVALKVGDVGQDVCREAARQVAPAAKRGELRHDRIGPVLGSEFAVDHLVILRPCAQRPMIGVVAQFRHAVEERHARAFEAGAEVLE